MRHSIFFCITIFVALFCVTSIGMCSEKREAGRAHDRSDESPAFDGQENPPPPEQGFQNPPPPPPPQRQGNRPLLIPSDEILTQISAAEDQIQALDELRIPTQEKQKAISAQIEQTEQALEKLLRAGASTDEDIINAIEAVNQARSARFNAEITVKLQVRKILGIDLFLKLPNAHPPKRPQHERVPKEAPEENQ